jgi:hypothetical protein
VNYYVRFGPKDDALYWLNKRVAAADPLYDGLRDDLRYVQLLGRTGLRPWPSAGHFAGPFCNPPGRLRFAGIKGIFVRDSKSLFIAI